MVRKYIIKNDFIPQIKENIACIGFFDGVHIGHQQLIIKTVNEAKIANINSCLICFDPDPNEIINKNNVKHILSFSDRLSLIESLGIDQIIVIKFNEEIMKMNSNNFIKEYLNKFNIKKLICGYDFTFGYKAKGNIDTLKKNIKFDLIVVDEYQYRKQKVSTTRIKNEIINGNIKLVNRLLGWEYFIQAKVIDCIKTNNKYIIVCKPKNNKIVIPNDGKYGDSFEIKNKKIYINGNKNLDKNTNILINFSYEQ